MGVTPLTGDLPWWATQQGPAGGPGPTGGPGATPQGGGQGWLQYLSQMFGPMGQGGADASNMPNLQGGWGGGMSDGYTPPWMQRLLAAQGGGNTADMPSADASNMAIKTVGAGDFVVPPPPAQPAPAPIATATQPYRGPMAAADASGHPPIAPGPQPVPARPDQFQTGGPELAAALARSRPPAGPAAQPFMPWRGPLAGDSPANIAAAGGAAGSNATSNPRFVPIDRPNMPAEGGGQSRGGPPQMSALNLAGLFGQGAANPNVPAANAQPVAAVRPVAGPLAANRGAPSAGPVDPSIIARQRMAGRLANDPSIIARQKMRGINPYS